MCNCKFVPMMMCCNCGENGNNGGSGNIPSGFKENVLYDGLINTVGTYNLTDDINNYDDLYIVHEYNTGVSRQCLCIPVNSLSASNLVCHGNSSVNTYVEFSIDKTVLDVLEVRESYRIVKIIGRKY